MYSFITSTLSYRLFNFFIKSSQRIARRVVGEQSRGSARKKKGKWIYLSTPEGDHFKSEKLVNMNHHNYKLEPMCISALMKSGLFLEQIFKEEKMYAVEIKKAPDRLEWFKI